MRNFLIWVMGLIISIAISFTVVCAIMDGIDGLQHLHVCKVEVKR